MIQKMQTATHRGLVRVPVTAIAESKTGFGDVRFPGTSDAREREARVRVIAACCSLLPPGGNVDVDVRYEAFSDGAPVEHEAAFDLVAALLVLKLRGFEVAAERIGLGKAEVLVVGDRLETDIAGGQSWGARTALVLSGVSTADQAAAWRPKPDIVAMDLAELVGA